jgi:hypothetical protein
MKNQKVFKAVIMEGVKTSSLVWVSFIKADSKKAIEDYVNTSDCELIHIELLDEWESENTDKPVNELVNGEMIYNDK